MNSKQKRFIVLILAVVVSAAIVYYKDAFVNLENYGYFGLFILSVIGNATIILPAPVVVAAFVGGGIFNPLMVGLITGLGSTVGETTSYMAGYGGKVVLENSKRLKRLTRWINKNGFLTIFFLALIPNPLFDLAGMTAGATGFSVGQFYRATFLGKTIRYVAISYLGANSLANF